MSWKYLFISCFRSQSYLAVYMRINKKVNGRNGQLMRLWYLSHRRPVTAQVSLRICTVSPEPLLFAHKKYGSRRRAQPIRPVARQESSPAIALFPLWSILESYIYSYQTWFKSIKGFAETDTVKIEHKKFNVRDLDLKAMYWDGDGTA